MKEIKIIECPRDAMQGIPEFIPTELKVKYINALLKVGFDTIDFGSFVSPRAIPQMKDTAKVLSKLELKTKSKLLAIIANQRGAEDAIQFDEIDYLGFPFSVSETFQKRNTNSNIEESLATVENIQEMTRKANKELVVYLSMGFGNPYGDSYHPDIVAKWLEKLSGFEIKIFALSDTVGIAHPKLINDVFSTVIPEFTNLEIGAHLHTTPETWKEKIKAAHEAGCKRFDGAIAGYGGCPMAKDDLTGNMPTEKLISYFEEHEVDLSLNLPEFEAAQLLSSKVFS